VLSNIIEGKIEWPEIGNGEGMISPCAYNFIYKLLDKNFERRLGSNSSDEIKYHLFF
jgi:hypothetical protein